MKSHSSIRVVFVLALVALLIPLVSAIDTYIISSPYADGYVTRSVTSEDLPTLIGGGGGNVDNSSNTAIVRLRSANSTDSNKYNYIARYESIWDTGSVLPDTFAITSAWLTVYFVDASDTAIGTPEIGIVGASSKYPNAVVRGDYNLSTNVLYSDSYLSPNATAWQVWNFNANGLSGISLTCTTVVHMRARWDIEETYNGLTWKPYQNQSGSYPRTAEYSKVPFLTINGYPVPVAALSNTSAYPLSGVAPLVVQFDDDSTGSATTWNWSIRTGAGPWTIVNQSQNATIQFSTAGAYDVNLTITNPAGTSTKEEIGYVVVATPPDTTPPASITNLIEAAASCSGITFTWTDPLDADLAYVQVFQNNTYVGNISAGTQMYTFSGLVNNTAYEIETHTFDTSGNQNTTWVNASATTDFACSGTTSGGCYVINNYESKGGIDPVAIAVSVVSGAVGGMFIQPRLPRRKQ